MITHCRISRRWISGSHGTVPIPVPQRSPTACAKAIESVITRERNNSTGMGRSAGGGSGEEEAAEAEEDDAGAEDEIIPKSAERERKTDGY